MKNIIILNSNNDLLCTILMEHINNYIDINEIKIINKITASHYLTGSIVIIFYEESTIDNIHDIVSLSQDFTLLIITLKIINFYYISRISKTGKKIAVISKSSKLEELRMVFNRIHSEDEQIILSNDIQKELLNEMISYNKIDIDYTDIEKKIISLAKTGNNIKETAKKLGLSTNTIAAYRSKILKKSKFKSFNKLVFNQ